MKAMSMQFLKTISAFYEDALEKGDPRVESWFLMKNPIPVFVIFILYLLMVKYGPKFMQNREPWNLRLIIVPYNALMVALSTYMFYEVLVSAVLARYSLKCQPVDYSSNPLAVRMASVCWWYCFSKILELLDTLFFILRKKNNQLTFLHVFHHSTMLINWWFYTKYVAGGQSFITVLLNTFVHMIMYSYYGLAAIGPQMQKYLWWKKYMTKLQLLQFFTGMTHTIINMASDCDFPRAFNNVTFAYGIIFISLFMNFYYQQYVAKSKHIENGKDQNGIVRNGIDKQK
ncbi:very long chain fatty acid elongase 4-like isoform X1 [Lineus longissimus]|uniref:very long chain fatty acid elongase 4-like isoform X1 n=1 Tax=Lineus longissimus TaxID=88925 RepID=UPI002B4F577C